MRALLAVTALLAVIAVIGFAVGVILWALWKLS